MKTCDFCLKKANRINIKNDYYYTCDSHAHLKLLNPRIKHSLELEKQLSKYKRK